MNDRNRALTPKLRFPGFAGLSYRIVQLEDVTEECTTRNERGLSSESVMGVTKAAGIIPMEERVIGSDLSRYKLVQKNWFAYNPMRLNIGSIARWQGDADILVSPDYVVFRCLEGTDAGINPEYLDHFRRSDYWDDFVTQSGIGSVRIRIYFNDIGRLQLRLPPPAEQRKIASCLTSLDEWIAAEARKLEALRAHKKGLMQQLFPREGETRPRLRFSEFESLADWELRSLEAVAPLQRGFDLPASDLKAGPVPVVYSNGIRAFHEVGMAKGPGLVTGRSGTIGAFHFIESGQYWPHNTSLWVTTFKGNVPKFVYYLFEAIRFERFASGSGVPTLNRNDVHAFVTGIPPQENEQEAIAACLSSLDGVIAALSRKLDGLRDHKKGLMQQLFPSPKGI